jgi:hypothetical protein
MALSLLFLAQTITPVFFGVNGGTLDIGIPLAF